MLKVSRILVSARAARLVLVTGAVVLGACGQKGPLFLPTSPATAARATLPQTLQPGGAATPPAPVASSPAR